MINSVLGERSSKKGILTRLGKNGKGRIVVILIGAVLGIGLLIFGGTDRKENNDVPQEGVVTNFSEYAESIEKKIHEFCSEVEGVSDVSVAVCFESGFEYVYAKEGDDGNYLVVGSGSSESAVRVTEKPPMIGGIGIVCKGGGDPSIQQRLINLISAAFGVGSNKIYITEAKG